MSATRPPSFDDRFTAPLEANRRGAHRARPNPVLGMLPYVGGVAVLAAVVVGAFTLLGGSTDLLPGGKDSSTVAGASTVASAAPSASVTPTATPTRSPSAASTPSATPSTPAAVPLDKTLRVTIYNGTTRNGLAADTATKLGTLGYRNTKVLRTTAPAATQTTVYFAKRRQSTTARQVAKALGLPRSAARKDPAKATDGTITVVLKSDYTG